MTVERNSNNKYIPPVIHGQKRKAQPNLSPLPSLLPVRVQVKLSDYAPLENPEKAQALAMRLKEIEERGEEVLLITRHEEELEEANRMREATTDEKHADGGISAPLVIPEINELERRLAGVAEEDVEGKRTVIREWVRGLHGTGSLKPLDEKGHPRRRYTKEVETEKNSAYEWVKRLNPLFDSLITEKIHISFAGTLYQLDITSISNWKDTGLLKEVGTEGNKILINEKMVALTAAISHKFGRRGSGVVGAAIRYYNSLSFN